MKDFGILVVDKPIGPTAHQIVSIVRRGTGIRKVGHAGTLDPRASGVLVLCLGQATRLSEYLSTSEKRYLAVIRFGDKYKQWNTAFDAGFCAALGKPYITLHSAGNAHPLKEVDAAAMAWAQTTEQVVEILKYVVAK